MRATRNTLALALGALSLGVGLLACFVQASNHARAQDLARLQRQWEMLEAANAQVKALVDAHVAGVPNAAPQGLEQQRKPRVRTGARE